MNKSKSLAGILSASVLLCGAVQAAESQQTNPLTSPALPASPCSFGAFVQESDPAGLNVRQTPGLSGKILGTLPPVIASKELDGYKVKVELDVSASSNGWFQISNARDNTELTGKSARPVFSGSGWVSGGKLTVKSQADKGYLRPDAASPVVLSLRDGSGFDNDEMMQAARLIGCQGAWVLVEFSTDKLSAEMSKLVVVDSMAQSGLPKGRFRAWLTRICAIQETSCDGLAAPN